MKYISKNVEGCRDGVPITTETRCKDGSVQARQAIRRHTQVTSSLHLFVYMNSFCWLCYEITESNIVKKKYDLGMGLLV